MIVRGVCILVAEMIVVGIIVKDNTEQSDESNSNHTGTVALPVLVLCLAR